VRAQQLVGRCRGLPVSTRYPLHDGWSVSAVGGPAPGAVAGRRVPATVPGCVHTDLLAAGLVPDPYLADNEHAVAWIGHTDWEYETTVDLRPVHPRTDLVCDGLDTVATVTLNDTVLGSTANMHRSYRFDARTALRQGRNRLRVRFDSALRHAAVERDRLGARPAAYPEPFNMIRKSACHFGWDWGPTLVSAGIWGPIGLHAWRDARLDTVRPVVTVRGRTGYVEVHVTVERDTDDPLTVVASVGDATATNLLEPHSNTSVLTLTVTDPRLWWPRGYGEQPRYPLEVGLRRTDGSTVDCRRMSVGFRSVRLDTADDEHGSAFTVVVNDLPVFVRGANWIPDDVFPTRVDRDRYRRRLRQACDAGVNYLRVWGGGRYESDDFYDLADALGLMVGQDFLFACAAYPEEEPLASEVAAEAAQQVTRLAPHPSLVMWVGNNENLWGFHDWDWQRPLDGRTWGAGYYFDLLPELVARLDPSRPYWPGSPYSGSESLHPNDPDHGTTHIWDVWNQLDHQHYRSWRPRFAAEFGYQGPPTYATLRRAAPDGPLTPESSHQKAADGALKLERGLAAHLPAPRDFDDWHYLTQLNQARAVSLGIEHFRSLRPLCMGTIMWQLNDCWPVTSWAAIDGDGRCKPLWYALRRAYADRLLTIQPRGAGLAVVAVNDGKTPWDGPVVVRRTDLDGRHGAEVTLPLCVPPGSATTLPLPAAVTTPGEASTELLVATADRRRAWWFFAEDHTVAYRPPSFDATVSPGAGGVIVEVLAHTLLRDLTLFPDRLDPCATVDDAMVTLLPGERARFAVRGLASVDPTTLTTRPVLRCVNDLTHG
jgi:beta-mannosidase